MQADTIADYVEAARQIYDLAGRPSTRIIAMTAKAFPEDRTRCLLPAWWISSPSR